MIVISDDLRQWLSEVRRDFHQHPETAYEEHRTTERISTLLSEMGVGVEHFDDMTGAVGLINGTTGTKTVALRADIDALNLNELNECDYRSTINGKMHACGHDAHTAIMLGVAKRLMESDLKGQLKGNVKFLFQPAEEDGAGAKRMIDRGVLENPRVDWVLAGHMIPEFPVGRVGISKGQSHASADSFKLTIEGKGGHGGRPHQTRDPIVAGGHLITALQTVVARNIDPICSGVITIGQFHAGSAPNIIPDMAFIEGTLRAIGHGARELLIQRVQEIIAGVETAFKVKCGISFMDGYPPCINDIEMSTFMKTVAEDIGGPGSAVDVPPSTGAEDFAYFAMERPGAIIRLGCGLQDNKDYYPLHSPRFNIDENVLAVGVQLFTEAVMRLVG